MAGPLASVPVGSCSLLMCQWGYLGQGEGRTLPCSLLEGATGNRDLPAVSKHSDKDAQHTAPPRAFHLPRTYNSGHEARFRKKEMAIWVHSAGQRAEGRGGAQSGKLYD